MIASASMLTRNSLIVLTALASVGCFNQSLGTTDAGNDAATTRDTASADDVSAVDASTTDAVVATDVQSSGDGGLVHDRPYTSRAPRTYDPAQPTPLVILLHGYGASGAGQDLYFGLGRIVDTRGFLYAYPDGTVDATGKRFWNASDACCNFQSLPVDDVAYVNAIIDDMSSRYNVDTHRIFVVGHSNGGFMSHRFACDASPRVAAFVSLAGVVWNDMTRCAPTQHVSVLQVHGDADSTVLYNGGMFGLATYPSARATVVGWGMRNGCTGTLGATSMRLDLDTALAGSETHVDSVSGCPADGAVDFWTIEGGSHIPAFGASWATTIYDWLMAHPKA